MWSRGVGVGVWGGKSGAAYLVRLVARGIRMDHVVAVGREAWIEQRWHLPNRGTYGKIGTSTAKSGMLDVTRARGVGV